ncbi:Hypothetical_protein [Hexamita inflata]|uniref:Hypothetical_protein n=1 Tax=Hexamita inflata TaxID=28002 RepID=A0AA86QIW7_9EUKA|nr:Hypothetical protein HINF_LOCUS46798 [Hexamita inflata]
MDQITIQHINNQTQNYIVNEFAPGLSKETTKRVQEVRINKLKNQVQKAGLAREEAGGHPALQAGADLAVVLSERQDELYIINIESKLTSSAPSWWRPSCRSWRSVAFGFALAVVLTWEYEGWKGKPHPAGFDANGDSAQVYSKSEIRLDSADLPFQEREARWKEATASQPSARMFQIVYYSFDSRRIANPISNLKAKTPLSLLVCGNVP